MNLKDALHKHKKLVMNVEDQYKHWDGRVIQQKLEDGKWTEVEFPNVVLIGGIQELMYCIWRTPKDTAINLFEDDLYTLAIDDERPNIVIDTSIMPYVNGYNVVIDGAQGDGYKKYPRHKKGYILDGENQTMVPWRVIPLSENDFTVYRHKYLHHRVVKYPDNQIYVEYYTKIPVVSTRLTLDNGTSLPQYPNDNLTTDKDSRGLAEFIVDAEDDELQEWFRLTQQGGARSTRYNGIVTMWGPPATWTDTATGNTYPTLGNCICFSRCNHTSVPHGVDGTIVCKYRVMHI